MARKLGLIFASLVIVGLLAVACSQPATVTTTKPTPAASPTSSPSATPKPSPTATTSAPATTAAPKPTTQSTTPPPPAPAIVALGGKLYDNWMNTAKIATPKENSPLWATQTTNTRTGVDTWRCKECHGWDYKGKDGAYSKGSHLTGFTGVYEAAKAKTAAELTAILKGSANPKHNFSTYLNEEQIS
ncbi:MAG: hypothetical protein Q7R57_00545, partial [Dehalococcoidales bacterium]|nr:hypothetical protein [Dehalococcoidales bacterium]